MEYTKRIEKIITSAIPEFEGARDGMGDTFDSWYSALSSLYDLALEAFYAGNEDLVSRIYTIH